MNTDIKEIINTGNFPTTQKAAISLINSINALREIEAVRIVEEKEKEVKREYIHAQHVYIKPIYKDTHVRYNNKGEVANEFTYKKVGPTIWKEIILAINKDEADKYIQRMVDREATDIKINKAKSMMILGYKAMRKLMTKINKDHKVVPIIGFRTFRRKGYKILRRTYLKPSVKALAKAEINFF